MIYIYIFFKGNKCSLNWITMKYQLRLIFSIIIHGRIIKGNKSTYEMKVTFLPLTAFVRYIHIEGFYLGIELNTSYSVLFVFTQMLFRTTEMTVLLLRTTLKNKLTNQITLHFN